jgi:hypothetical protein
MLVSCQEGAALHIMVCVRRLATSYTAAAASPGSLNGLRMLPSTPPPWTRPSTRTRKISCLAWSLTPTPSFQDSDERSAPAAVLDADGGPFWHKPHRAELTEGAEGPW